ncbi:MAG: hypothetical protein QNJ45_18585 [Ardenticatenaceae bacterium]|nr:hypothetical protein [Ardenticatenaceae bacterium]
MLKFEGAIDREFTFPAGQKETFAFFADFGRIVSLLSDIDLVGESQENAAIKRLCYRSNEMGVYAVETYCDVLAEIDETAYQVRLMPQTAADFSKIKTEMTPTKTVSVGDLNATLTCLAHEPKETMIRYQFKMASRVAVNGMMRFIPLDPIQQMVQNLIKNRLDQQVNQFIKNAIHTYSDFKEEQNQ